MREHLRSSISHSLIIFYHPDTPIDTELLEREAEIIPAFRIEKIDVTTPQGYVDTIRFSCIPGYCVVTNKYRQHIVRLSKIPVSFFQLREYLQKLGYMDVAKAIAWI